MIDTEDEAMDGPTEEEVEHAMEVASILYNLILEGMVSHPGGVDYALWLTLTRHLVDSGWSAEELLRALKHHATDQEMENAATHRPEDGQVQ